MTPDVTLRTYAFLDRLQPQFAAFVASNVRGYLPVAGQASLYFEIEPAMALLGLTDVARKATSARPALQIIERAYGLLEIHDEDPAEVRAAGELMLDRIGCSESDRMKPSILASDVITRVDEHQAMLVNRMRKGSMLTSFETLYILEVHPAGYAALAANEAEKRVGIDVLHVVPYGAFGRLWLGGSEAEIREAEIAVRETLESVDGVVVAGR